jgi:hypothetical protein
VVLTKPPFNVHRPIIILVSQSISRLRKGKTLDVGQNDVLPSFLIGSNESLK